jgi:hypothetical protein
LRNATDSHDPELRNTIYGFCANGDKVSMSRGATSYSRLACLGLTQVCREIRKEFRPIFLESTPALLEDPSELCSYIETFYPTADAQVLKGYQGDITIRISPRQLPSTCTH